MSDWFGNFLNIDYSISTTDEDLTRIKKDRENAWALLSDYSARNQFEIWKAYKMLASPAANLTELRARKAFLAPATDPCRPETGALAADRLRPLLCEATPGSASNANAAAANGLKVSMAARRAIDVAGWIMVEQALVDLRAVRKNGPVSSLELIRFNPEAPRTQGEDHTARALLTLDAAVANAAAVNGDFTVEAVLAALTAPPEADAEAEKQRQARLAAARGLLSEHAYLARNVATALLKDRYGVYVAGARIGGAPGSDAYRYALKLGEEAATGDPYALLKTLFGTQFNFTRSPRKKVFVELLPADGDRPAVLAPVPEPLAFAEGRFYYPEELYDLFEKREQVGTRLLDYRAFRDLKNDAQRLVLTRALARAEIAP